MKRALSCVIEKALLVGERAPYCHHYSTSARPYQTFQIQTNCLSPEGTVRTAYKKSEEHNVCKCVVEGSAYCTPGPGIGGVFTSFQDRVQAGFVHGRPAARVALAALDVQTPHALTLLPTTQIYRAKLGIKTGYTKTVKIFGRRCGHLRGSAPVADCST